MSYYHIRITPKSTPSKTEVELDLSFEELMKRFVHQYERGSSIVIAGRIVDADDIERIQINESEEDSSILNSALLQRQKQQNALIALDHKGKLPPRILAGLGEDVTPKFISGPPGIPLHQRDTDRQTATSNGSIKVFISHSSNDVELAQSLIDLLQKALHLTSNDIRCTSVDGFRMPAGASIDDTLRAEVYHSVALIGLVTPQALASAYVIFELGARWGARRLMIPLLASGVTAEHLEEPLSGKFALDASQEGQVLQLVEDVAGYLDIEADKPSSYAAAVNELVRLSNESATTAGRVSTGVTQPELSEEAKKLLIGSSAGEGAPIGRLRLGTRLKVVINESYYCNTRSSRETAMWEQVLYELVEQGLIEDIKGQGEVFHVTNKGFEVADSLRDKQ